MANCNGCGAKISFWSEDHLHLCPSCRLQKTLANTTSPTNQNEFINSNRSLEPGWTDTARVLGENTGRVMDKIKNIFVNNSVPNPYGVPEPGEFSTLVHSSPEGIIKQYTSMREKTLSYFEYSESTGSLMDYSSAVMRYSAYSSVCVFGVCLYFINDKNGVKELIPERLNSMIYDKVLYDIADFSWVMLQYCFRKHSQSRAFSEQEIEDFLNNEVTPELYWTSVFSYLTGQSNAEFAYKKFKEYVTRVNLFEPKKLDETPSSDTKLAFDEMLKCGLIGDPNDHRLFDAKHLIDTIGEGPVAINKKRKVIENSMVCRLLEPEVRLHLVRGF